MWDAGCSRTGPHSAHLLGTTVLWELAPALGVLWRESNTGQCAPRWAACLTRYCVIFWEPFYSESEQSPSHVGFPLCQMPLKCRMLTGTRWQLVRWGLLLSGWRLQAGLGEMAQPRVFWEPAEGAACFWVNQGCQELGPSLEIGTAEPSHPLQPAWQLPGQVLPVVL